MRLFLRPGLRRCILSLALGSCCACTDPAGDPAAGLGASEQALSSVTLMVVGDSISHGLEGDFTWRYRLWDHLRAQGVGAQLVGPWTGTHKLGPWQGSGAPPSHAGAYRPGIPDAFPRGNLAEWGWMMGEAKWVIGEQVQRYLPELLLVELGFNDIAWNLSDTPPEQIAAGVHESLRQLVQNARLANPRIKVLIADAPQRTPIENYPELPGKIAAYNRGLDAVIAGLSRSDSPVHRVYFDLLYDQQRDTYDGLHPNVRGEYVIAKAFADELSKKLGIGASMALPGSMPADLRPGATGAMTVRVNADYSADLSWPHVFGAGGFWIWTRDLTRGDADFQRLMFPIGADGWRASVLPAGHRIQYRLQTMRGDYSSADFSPTTSLETPAPPEVRITSAQAQATSVRLSWTAASGADDYHVYASAGCGEPDPASFVLVQWGLGAQTSWTQQYITSPCMNYYVVASRNGGEGPRPPITRVAMGRCDIDDSAIPAALTQARAFAQSLRSSCSRDYEAVIARLVATRYEPPRFARVVFAARPFDLDAPAAVSGIELQINYDYVQRNPGDHGMVLHELTHIIQSYPGAAAPWAEGIADWVRYQMGEPPPGHAGGAANCQGGAHYLDGYQCTAAFLDWVGRSYSFPIAPKVNELLHHGNAAAVPTTFELISSRTLPELWRSCLQSTCAGGSATR